MNREPSDGVEPVDYHPETEAYRATFDASIVRPSVAFIEMFASIRGTEPTSIEPLYGCIDLDALDHFLTRHAGDHRHGDRTVEFTCHDRRVTVKSFGVIEIVPLSVDDGDGSN